MWSIRGFWPTSQKVFASLLWTLKIHKDKNERGSCILNMKILNLISLQFLSRQSLQGKLAMEPNGHFMNYAGNFKGDLIGDKTN